jgi:hypothetical protein
MKGHWPRGASEYLRECPICRGRLDRSRNHRLAPNLTVTRRLSPRRRSVAPRMTCVRTYRRPDWAVAASFSARDSAILVAPRRGLRTNQSTRAAPSIGVALRGGDLCAYEFLFALPRTSPYKTCRLCVARRPWWSRELPCGARAVSLVGSTRTRRLGRSPSPVDRTAGRIARLVRGSARGPANRRQGAPPAPGKSVRTRPG